ncbi:MFS transporter [Bacillus sp. ISL-18]|uniref:MFS transporter n=1 Tax=Bacillus sp. ISL-18 TaxID=2819118 RepID=UPI001BEA4B74|nr:MFS transporter [Bacillus sp. ISL-18]MBT2653725.1 MFS transporter [Bacillus sp. ISL-18]
MKDKIKAPNGNSILLALYFTWIVSYIDRTTINLSIVQMGKDLSLDASQLGIILSAFFFGYALMQIPGGWLADRFGSRNVIVVAILMWSIFTALTGFSWSLTSLFIIRLLFGLGEGAFPAGSTKAISDYFSKEKRTKAQSTMMSSNGLGAAIAPILVAPLLVWLGWRHVFLAISVLGIISIIWFLFSTRTKGEFADSEKAQKPSKEEYQKLLRNSYVWKVLIIFFFVNITSWGLMSWMPSYLMQVLGINLKSVGFLSAIPTLFLTIGMIISGRIINRFGSYAKAGVLTGIIIMGISLYLMAQSTTIFQVILFQSIAFTFLSYIFSFIFTLPHRALEPKIVGTAFGIINFGGQAAGIFSPIIMGALISASGGSYKSAFMFLTICCVVAGVITLFLPSTKKQAVVVNGAEKTVS